MELKPLGDQGLLAYLPNEASAIRFASDVRDAEPGWLIDVVPAYASVGVFFDPDQAKLDDVTSWLNGIPSGVARQEPPARTHVVPVCYEMGPDLGRVAEVTGLSAEEVVATHFGAVYTVYAIGFVPGFPYLGYLPERLCGVGRLPSPRVRVEPGSVGLTGRQTGVYPLARPGGWNLIGRTPLTLVDVADGYFPLRVGDTVRFERIDEAEYRRRQGERIETC